jgi:hypothetical protein
MHAQSVAKSLSVVNRVRVPSWKRFSVPEFAYHGCENDPSYVSAACKSAATKDRAGYSTAALGYESCSAQTQAIARRLTWALSRIAMDAVTRLTATSRRDECQCAINKS